MLLLLLVCLVWGFVVVLFWLLLKCVCCDSLRLCIVMLSGVNVWFWCSMWCCVSRWLSVFIVVCLIRNIGRVFLFVLVVCCCCFFCLLNLRVVLVGLVFGYCCIMLLVKIVMWFLGCCGWRCIVVVVVVILVMCLMMVCVWLGCVIVWMVWWWCLFLVLWMVLLMVGGCWLVFFLFLEFDYVVVVVCLFGGCVDFV